MLSATDLLTGLRFDPPDDPLVSVVVPAFEHFGPTVHCLRSLAERTPAAAFEVIVVDDCSLDPSYRRLESVPGLRVVRTRSNGGFSEAVNAGVAEAKGSMVFLLNNDTEVRSGWLVPLVQSCSEPGVAAVGCKLVYPDGRLQEAGGIVFNDGSGANIGFGDSPVAPEVNFRRDVDYCSAAALMVRVDVLRDVGGLDTLFSPGFYEDTDLCFEVRSRGYRVLYDPRAVVVHQGGATFGTEDQPGTLTVHTKTSQFVNRYRFVAKWVDELVLHRSAGPVRALDDGRRGRGPNVLVFDHVVPEPDRDSGSLRMYWILRLLAEAGCRVTLVPANTTRTMPYSTALNAVGVEVWAGPSVPPAEQLVRQRQGLYDLVLISRPDVAATFLDMVTVWQPGAMVVYDTVDLHELRLRREMTLSSDRPPTAPQMTRAQRTAQLERMAIIRTDASATVTDSDADALRQAHPGVSTIVLPNVHERRAGDPPPFDEREGLLFIGGFAHPPNVDAVEHLAADILPELAGRLDVATSIIGSHPPDVVTKLASERLAVLGFVPDVVPRFDRARVFVAPLRYGSGMKGKVGQAMSLGLPVVTTSIGAEGMDLVHGEHALVADDPASFADAVVRLHSDRDLWARLAANAGALVQERWSPDAMARRLDGLLARCVSPVRRRRSSPVPGRATRQPSIAVPSPSFVEDLSDRALEATWEPTPAAAPDGGERPAPRPVGPARPAPSWDRRTSVPAGRIEFTCNICGAGCEAVASELRRDVVSCLACGSTVRHRSVVATLSTCLYGESRAIPSFAIRRDIKGLGCSDWLGYAPELSQKFTYMNTFSSLQPRLDLTAPVVGGYRAAHDFVICSDVVDHLDAPIDTVLGALHDLLRPGGLLVLTVPPAELPPAIEHRSESTAWEPDLVGLNAMTWGELPELASDPARRLRPPDAARRRERLLKELEAARLTPVPPVDLEDPQHGVVHADPHSEPIAARRG